jgi:4-hydroxy-2-oxoglutarate aldolase
MLIDGIHIPLTTPFNRDGSLYLRKLEYNVGRYSLTPAAGFVALLGEGAALSEADTNDALRVIGSIAGSEKVLIAAITRDSVRACLAIAEQAASSHFDAVLLAAPTYADDLTPAELTLFFQAVAEASPLPVLLSSVAGSGFALSIALVAQLARHPNILGMYDADLSIARHGELAHATLDVKHQVTVTQIFAPVTRRMLTTAGAATLVTAAALAGGTATVVGPSGSTLKTRTKSVGFQIMAEGSAFGMVELLESGVAGALPRLAAAAPQACFEAYAALKDGDAALAAEKQQRLAEADALIAQLGIAGVKYGCDLNGYFGGTVRLPRLDLDAAQKRELERVLSSLKN